MSDLAGFKFQERSPRSRRSVATPRGGGPCTDADVMHLAGLAEPATEAVTDVSTDGTSRGSAALASAITVAALITGTILRWSQLGLRSLWFDEGYTAWAVSKPLNEIIGVIRADTAPPLYYLILHGWTVLFGRSEVALRSLSAFFATAALFVFAALARQLLKNKWATAAAVWLFALSFMQVAYAHEARFYAMMTFLGAIDLYLVLLVCEDSSSARLLAVLIAWTASLYTNNMMLVYLGTLGCVWLIAPGKTLLRKRLIQLVIVSGLAGLAFAPWLPALLAQTAAVRGHFWPEVPDSLALRRTFAVLAGVHEQSLGDIGLQGFLMIDLGLIGFVVASLRTRRLTAAVGALGTFTVLPVVIIFVYSHMGQSIFMERAFLVSGIGIPLLVALPLAIGLRGFQRAIVTAGVLTLVWLSARSLPIERLGVQEENWREVSSIAVDTPAKHRLMVFVANEGEMLYDYYVRGGDYSPRPELVGLPSGFFAIDPPHTMRHVESDRDLDDLRRALDRRDYDEVVFIASHNWFADPPHRTLELLQTRFKLMEQKTISRITLFRFSVTPANSAH